MFSIILLYSFSILSVCSNKKLCSVLCAPKKTFFCFSLLFPNNFVSLQTDLLTKQSDGTICSKRRSIRTDGVSAMWTYWHPAA